MQNSMFIYHALSQDICRMTMYLCQKYRIRTRFGEREKRKTQMIIKTRVEI